MITKSELQAAHRASRATGAYLEPPSAEETLKYVQGELSEADTTRVRELLVAHPDMLRAATMPFPPDAVPGSDGFLSEYETARQWKSFRRSMGTASPDRSLNVWRAAAALAAALAITLGGLLWQSAENARRLTRQLTEPRVAGYQLLLPDGQRGPGGASTLTPVGDSYLVATPILGAVPFDQYRLEIVDLASNRSVWRRDGLPRPDSDTFAILIPRQTFHPGMFQIVLYGVNGKLAEKVATYTVTVPKSAS
jgi:hypothetical protein